MNPATLKRLLIDHQLGELNPDAAELLADYLRLMPADPLRNEASQTLAVIRSALASDLPDNETLPALRSSTMKLSLRAPASLRLRAAATWTRYGALAAAILLSFALGDQFGGRLDPRSTGGAERFAQSRQGPAVETSSFWSAARLQSLVSTKSATSGRSWSWSSPLSPPRTGA